MNRPPQTKDEQRDEEPPPFGRSWAVLYALVLANLAVLVVLFYLFTRAFR
jgi:hypothetical protein